MARPKRNSVPGEMLVHLLKQAGFLPLKGRIDPLQVRKAVREYQRFHAVDLDGNEVLKVDGWAGPKTERHLKQPRFCLHGDRMELSAKGRWSPSIATSLKWGVTGTPDSLPLATFKEKVQQAFDQWSAVCNLSASYTKNEKVANFIIGAGKIDGPSGTLAWSHLPQGMDYTSPPIKQLYDTAERFDTDINILAVLTHEIGHGIGLPHLAQGNLLQPMYDARITKPQRGDTEEVVALYGEPQGKADPVSPPGELQTITIQGYGIKVVG